MLAAVWTAIFFLTALLSLVSLSEARKDRLALTSARKDSGPYVIVAKWAEVSEAIRLAVYLVYLTLGIAAMVDPKGGVIAQAGPLLTVGAFGMMVNTAQTLRNRRRVLAFVAIDRRYKAKEKGNKNSAAQQSPPRGPSERVVGSAGRSRLGHGPKRKDSDVT